MTKLARRWLNVVPPVPSQIEHWSKYPLYVRIVVDIQLPIKRRTAKDVKRRGAINIIACLTYDYDFMRHDYDVIGYDVIGLRALKIFVL